MHFWVAARRTFQPAFTKVDKYNSPDVGHKITATSSISLSVSKLDGKLKLINLGFVSVNAFFTIDALTLTSSGSLTYDESLQQPVTGSDGVDLEAKTSISAGVSGVAGVDYCNITIEGAGSVDLSVAGTAKKDGTALKFVGDYGASALTFGIKVYAKVFSLKCELYETNENNKPTFGSPVSGPIDVTLYSFPQ